MTVRPAEASELDQLARLWHAGWHDGHGHIAPRAARFYEKRGWVNARTQTNRLEVPEGVFEIRVWRFEKPPVR